MKKRFVLVLTLLLLSSCSSVYAERHCDDCHSSPPPASVIITEKEYETALPGCSRHFLLVKETTKSYGANDVRVSRLYTIYNSDGSVIISNCTNVQHLLKDLNHYFLINNSQIVDEYGSPVTGQTYNSASIITNDRIKVSKNISFAKPGYGVIDYSGQEIIPPIYQKLKQSKINSRIYLSKKDGYWGLIDIDGNILLRNDYDSLKELYNTYVFKKYSYYGLADINGQNILRAEYDKIERLGEYITVKKSGKWGILDRNGKRLYEDVYQDVKLERNILYGKTNGNWVRL